ncbi:MAG: conjugal transfer protein TraF, partial [Campylobacterota bacterium]|nr:conjugal transfer protein TraF [Campylobacterota bacterium]
MKKVISLALLGATTSLMAMYAEQAYLYKDPRIMGMGGANVAVGAYSTSVFSNPAGLTNIKKDHGFVVDLLGLGVSASSETQQFIDDIDAASDSESEMAKILSKYSGEHFHIGVDNYTSISKNSDAFAWSIGLLAAADVNFMAHGHGSEMGELLETTSRAYGGVVLGVAKPYETDYGRLDIGVGLKYISQKSYEGSLGISELVGEDDDIGQKLQDRYEKSSSGIGLDLGVNYHPFADSYWHPTFGLSVLNIGSMK